MIQSVQKAKHRQHRALRTSISVALILSCLCLLSSCHQDDDDYRFIDATLSSGLRTRIMGTDGNFTSPSYAPASRGALITTTNFGTYYPSFGFQAIREDSMTVYVSAAMEDKDSTGTDPNFYKHFYSPKTGSTKWPSKKNASGSASYVPLSFFCFGGDSAFVPTVTVPKNEGVFLGVSQANLANYVIPDSVANQKDCLIGITEFITPEITGSGSNADFTADAKIYFSHALTAINFEVGSITPGITIDSLTISGIDGKGTLQATHSFSSTSKYYIKDDKTTTDKNEDEIIWKTDSAKNASYTTAVGFEIIGSDDPEHRTATKQAVYSGTTLSEHGAPLDTTADQAHSFILLPQQIKDAKLTIKYTYRGTKFEQTADIKDYTWKRSNKYIYALNLTLQDFGFTLYVQDWVNGGTFPEEGYNW